MRKEIIRIFAAMAVIFLVVPELCAGGKKPRFEVISTIPTDRARGVPTDQMLTVTFNQKVDCSTVTTSTFTLKEDGERRDFEWWGDKGHHHGAVAGIVNCLGTQATFTPESDLEANTKYCATIDEKVKSVQGQKLEGNGLLGLLECGFVWCFKTGSTPTPPTVTAVTPLNNATGVALNTAIITATFDQAMNGATINSSTFLLTGPGATPVIATTISYDALNNTATFVLPANLTASTLYTATITTGATNLSGNALASNFVWTFKTGATLDIIPPTVILTNPLNGATDVPLNQIITATFSEAMAASTITTPSQFTLQVTSTSAPVSGAVTYAAVGNTATFTPTLNLASSTQYTATIKTGVTDLAGNHLVSNYVWKFTTGAATVTTAPTVVSTNPASNATGVCIGAGINATFSEAMDFGTFNSGTFYVTGPASAPVLGTLSVDVTGRIVTFTPTSPLASSTPYQATITTGVTDLFGNPLGSNHVWSFTTGTGTCVAAVPLNSAAPFGGFGGGAGMTNMGVNTVINGDIGTTGVSTTMTGFHDNTSSTPYNLTTGAGCIYTETTLNIGDVTGGIYTAPPPPTVTCPNEGTGPLATTPGSTFYIATQAAADALTAYNALAALPTTGPDPSASGNLGGITVYPGVYASASGAFSITGSDLTLDAQGNANAVWVFKMSTGGLTVGAPGAPRNVILLNGAQAKNVFWQVYSAATINGAGGGTMVGTIIAKAGVTISTAGNLATTTLNGRAIGLNASVTIVNTVINVPAP